MSEKVIYSMNRVGKVYPPNKQVLGDISLSYFYGAKIGVLGLNGAGKSTLLRIMAGVETDFQGEVAKSPGYSIGYLEQEPELDNSLTVRQIVEEGVAEVVAALKEFEEINEKFADPDLDGDAMTALIERQGEVQETLDRLDAWDLDSRLDLAMAALGCPDPETSVEVLSGGERRRVALCRLLLKKPDILLLDEPTNHLDAESVAWLEGHLQSYSGTVIAVTHDRYFLDNVAGWILELDRGRGIPWKGNYSSWLEQKSNRLAQEEKKESDRQRTLQRELEWIRMAPRARQAKNKARIGAYQSLLEQSHERSREDMEIFIPPGPRLGDVVVHAEGVKKSFGDKLLFENLEFDLPPGGIVGIVGPNGAGKSTLFRMIVDQESPDAGSFTVGETVQCSYVDQSRSDLSSDKTVWEEISGGHERIQLGDRDIASRAYVSRFGFSGASQQKNVGALSGGERNRLHLAKMLKEGGNLLLLDEPTNDLDVNTLRALEEALLNFGGCVVVISHDRWFLDRVCTHTLAYEGDGTVFYYPGPYSEYEADRRKRMGDAADVPSRMRHMKLTRT